ncbi:MAG TPA: acyl-CoA dehydrogenase family protein, partial [Actinomycetota bacterium]
MSELDRFALPDELEEFRALVRRVAEERIAPRAAEIDETDEWPKDVYEVLVENDLMGVGYPEEHGGSGGGSLAFGVFIEELSRVSAGVSLTPLVSKLGVIPLVVAGDDDKAERMTRGIASGELLMSYALTEAGA